MIQYDQYDLFSAFIPFAAYFLFVAFFTYHNEIWFNADGSGRYMIRLDIGELIHGMESAMTDLGESWAEMDSWDGEDEEGTDNDWWSGSDGGEIASPWVEEGDDMPAGEDWYDGEDGFAGEEHDWKEETWEMPDTNAWEAQSDWEAQQSKSWLDDFFEEFKGRNPVDTTLVFYDVTPDTIKAKIADVAYLKKTSSRIYADSSTKEAFMEIYMDFAAWDEMPLILGALGQATDQDLNEIPGMEGLDIVFDATTKSLSVPSKEYRDPFGLDESGGSLDDEEVYQNIKMMLEMFGMSELSMTYHLPGMVEHVEGEVGHEVVSDDTVKITIDMLQCIRNGMTPGYKITFK